MIKRDEAIPRKFLDTFKALGITTRNAPQSEDARAEMVELYWRDLNDLPHYAIYEAAARLSKHSTWFPSSGEWHEAASGIVRAKAQRREDRSRDCERCGGKGWVLITEEHDGPTFDQVLRCEREGGHDLDDQACRKCGATREALRIRAFQLVDSRSRHNLLEAARLLGVGVEKLRGHEAARMGREAAARSWPFAMPVTRAHKCHCRGGAELVLFQPDPCPNCGMDRGWKACPNDECARVARAKLMAILDRSKLGRDMPAP